MAGPSQTSTSAGATSRLAAAASSTPPARPRQPAWAAATREPSRRQNRAGRQSAVIMVTAMPGVAVQAASAWSTRVGSASTTALPWTCSSQAGRHPRAWPRRRRFSVTAAGSSPTWLPRLRLAKGAWLTPPARVVTQAWTPTGAGQSGRSQSAPIIRRIPDPGAADPAARPGLPAVATPSAGVRRSPDDPVRGSAHAVPGAGIRAGS